MSPSVHPFFQEKFKHVQYHKVNNGIPIYTHPPNANALPVPERKRLGMSLASLNKAAMLIARYYYLAASLHSLQGLDRYVVFIPE
jgi:hypothetical protein